MAEGLAPAGDARVGLNLYQEMVHGGKAQAGELLFRRPHVERNAYIMRRNGCDLHRFSWTMGGKGRRGDKLGMGWRWRRNELHPAGEPIEPRRTGLAASGLGTSFFPLPGGLFNTAQRFR
jgi:hypothetical protein